MEYWSVSISVILKALKQTRHKGIKKVINVKFAPKRSYLGGDKERRTCYHRRRLPGPRQNPRPGAARMQTREEKSKEEGSPCEEYNVSSISISYYVIIVPLRFLFSYFSYNRLLYNDITPCALSALLGVIRRNTNLFCFISKIIFKYNICSILPKIQLLAETTSLLFTWRLLL